jgi:hypothetical protein
VVLVWQATKRQTEERRQGYEDLVNAQLQARLIARDRAAARAWQARQRAQAPAAAPKPTPAAIESYRATVARLGTLRRLGQQYRRVH